MFTTLEASRRSRGPVPSGGRTKARNGPTHPLHLCSSNDDTRSRSARRRSPGTGPAAHTVHGASPRNWSGSRAGSSWPSAPWPRSPWPAAQDRPARRCSRRCGSAHDGQDHAGSARDRAELRPVFARSSVRTADAARAEALGAGQVIRPAVSAGLRSSRKTGGTLRPAPVRPVPSVETNIVSAALVAAKEVGLFVRPRLGMPSCGAPCPFPWPASRATPAASRCGLLAQPRLGCPGMDALRTRRHPPGPMLRARGQGHA